MTDWWSAAASFDLFEAIRRIHREAGAAPLVGTGSDPGREPLRFASNVSFAFPASDLQSIGAGADGRPRAVVNVLGIASPTSKGSLPPWYARLLLEAERDGNAAMRDFLDLFNHRLMSLYFRAWLKHNLPVRYELDRPPARPGATFELQRTGAIQGILLALVGLGSNGLVERLGIDPRTLLHHPAAMLRRPASAVGLECVLEAHFGIPFAVESFVARLLPLEPDARTRLDGSKRLGIDTVVGDGVMSAQSRFRLHVGPLDYQAFASFLPGGAPIAELRQLVSALVGDEFDYDLRLELAEAEVPGLRLWSDDARAQQLGWSTWLGQRLHGGNARDTLVPTSRHEGSTP
ncbi:MAG: type VI secretion system baseplate subunit TssG [Planctomycetes bacterium]|nr:type VI secretion system baseplate subunit TssG [Planctomycetota bacterium]